MFRLLYNGFNVFDKKSGRIDYIDQAGSVTKCRCSWNRDRAFGG